MVEWILQLKQSPSTCIMVPSAPPFPPMHSPLLQFLWFFSHHLISHSRPIYSSLDNDGLDHKPSHNRHTFLLSSFQMIQVKETASTPVSWTKICCISWFSSLILHICSVAIHPKTTSSIWNWCAVVCPKCSNMQHNTSSLTDDKRRPTEITKEITTQLL